MDVREGDFERKTTIVDENLGFYTGNLTADPVARISQSGVKSCRMTLANHRITNGERTTVFIPIVAYGKLAEVFETIGHKGCACFIRGKLDVWTGQQEVVFGEEKAYTDVQRFVITVQFARLNPKERKE